MRCLFTAVAAQRLFLVPVNPSPVYPGQMQAQMQTVVVQPVVQPSGWANPSSGATGWIAANPMTSCAALVGLVYLAKNGLPERLSALAVSGLPARATSRADIEMNTKYQPGVFAAIGKKKNPKTGDTLNLKGYTVGSRAPKVAKNSGTINQFGYGIGNLYGGGKRETKTKYAPVKGKIEADATGVLLKIGTVWLGLIALFVLSQIGGGD